MYLQMSKSKGNVVDPHSLLSNYGVDPLRYFLLKESSLAHDGGQCTTKNQKTHSYSLSLPPSFLPLPLSLSHLPPSLSLSVTDYSKERLVATTNADLPNTLGNLLQRISTPRLNPGGPRLQFYPGLFPTFGGSNFHSSPSCRASEEDIALVRGLQNLPGNNDISTSF